MDTIIHTISDKLASPLETLKRRGVPVDRLLQHQPQLIQPSMTHHQQQQQVQSESNYEYHESHTQITGRVKDFSRQHANDEKNLSSIPKKGRTYTQSKFVQQEHFKDDIDHSCEAVPSANMTRHKDLFHSLPLYIEKNVQVNEQMFDQARQLAWLLVGLARHVFQMPIESFHLYRDIDGGTSTNVLFFQFHQNLLVV